MTRNVRSRREKRINQLITLIVVAITSLFLNGFLIVNMIFSRADINSKVGQINQNESTIEQLEQQIGEEQDYFTQYISQLEFEKTENEKEIERLKADLKRGSVVYSTGKIAYLTFDDGPTSLTESVLDVLDEYNVKATFFVLGTRVNNYPNLLRRMIASGHTIGNHSKSHDYSYIYKSSANLKKEIEETNQLIYDITDGYEVFAFRFPGGSSNTMFYRYGKDITLNEWLYTVTDLGLNYYDWNVSSLDASSTYKTADEITKAVLDSAKNKQQITVLMHDGAGKKSTLEALPRIIQGLQDQGFEIKAITQSSKPVQHKIPD